MEQFLWAIPTEYLGALVDTCWSLLWICVTYSFCSLQIQFYQSILVWLTKDQARAGNFERNGDISSKGWVTMPIITEAPGWLQGSDFLALFFICSVRQIPSLQRRQPPKDQTDLSYKKALTGTAKTKEKPTKSKCTTHSVIQMAWMMLKCFESQPPVSKRHCDWQNNWNLPGKIKLLLASRIKQHGRHWCWDYAQLQNSKADQHCMILRSKQLHAANPNAKNMVGIATIDMLRPTYPSSNSLTNLHEREKFQGIACFRDKNNNELIGKGVILLVFYCMLYTFWFTPCYYEAWGLHISMWFDTLQLCACIKHSKDNTIVKQYLW